MSSWDGGVRTIALVSGGFLPKQLWGKTADGYIHICDWYSTFSHLAGVDPTDAVAEKFHLPPIDSINQWPYLLSLAHNDSAQGARTVVPLGSGNSEGDHNGGALIVGDFKILMGGICNDIWNGPVYPNQTWGLDDELDLDLSDSETPILSVPPLPNRSYPALGECGGDFTRLSLSANGKPTSICDSRGQHCWNMQRCTQSVMITDGYNKFRSDGSASTEEDGSDARELSADATGGCACGNGSNACTNQMFSLTPDGQLKTTLTMFAPGVGPSLPPPLPPAGSCLVPTGTDGRLEASVCRPGDRWTYNAETHQLMMSRPGKAPQCVHTVHPAVGPVAGDPRNICGNCSGGCLFNIRADPNEHHDLAASQPAKLAEMVAAYKRPLPLPLPPAPLSLSLFPSSPVRAQVPDRPS